MGGPLTTGSADAQQAPTIAESLLEASLADLVGSARGGSGAVQAYYVTRLARRLNDLILESMEDAPSASEFPGSSVVLELSDLVGPESAGGAPSLVDPSVTQGVRELVAWYALGSWNRGSRDTRAICEADESDFAARLVSTNSWWRAPERIDAARSLAQALGLFYERSAFAGIQAPAESVSVCVAEGADVVSLALTVYPGEPQGPTVTPSITLQATRSTTAPQSQIDLVWQSQVPGTQSFDVQHRSAGTADWDTQTRPADVNVDSVRDLVAGTTYEFRVRARADAAIVYSDIVTAATAQEAGPPVREAWWKRPQFVLPAVGALIGGIILWASDGDDGPKDGTVIVRIPVP